MTSIATEQEKMLDNDVFTGNIYIFHAFDIGDEINLEKVKESSVVSVPDGVISNTVPRKSSPPVKVVP